MKNKKIFILFVAIVFIFTFINKSFATDDTILTETLPSIDSIVGDSDNWFVYFNENTGTYYIVISQGTITYYPDDGAYSFKVTSLSYQYKLIDEEWSLLKSFEIGYITWSFDITTCICASNFDIYDTSNNLVFRKAPTLSTLTGIFSTQIVKGATQEIMRIIPLIIVVVVSLVGLRKAWDLLSNLLHKA